MAKITFLSGLIKGQEKIKEKIITEVDIQHKEAYDLSLKESYYNLAFRWNTVSKKEG